MFWRKQKRYEYLVVKRSDPIINEIVSTTYLGTLPAQESEPDNKKTIYQLGMNGWKLNQVILDKDMQYVYYFEREL